ncbi:hypothetical protein MKI84_14080 [Ancylobacter sp. A5.8]|uniref:hypothetical protein n=1 Tax=Ancylobacter gelatini TaxID=2919920 RepID=UPI001F4DE419|nr:hypothetical protein [Ancylobacter gelatini]MCJ8144045.1 hypothetical protein [Ancylobacter gelatini]
MNARSPRLAGAVLGAVAAFALAGCSDEAQPESRERVTASASNEIARKTWLQPTDGTPPGLWLASRDSGHDLSPDAPAVAGWHARLADADERFGETDRMIANRAVQLEAMLGEIGIKESAEEIIAGFAAFAGKGARAGFSDLCQHYYNLRAQGLSREASFAALKAEAQPGGAP